MTPVADTALELARWQFALTTLFHFIFVPLTLGLAPGHARIDVCHEAVDGVQRTR